MLKSALISACWKQEKTVGEFYASPEVGINVFPWVYGPGLHFALYYSYGTNKADVLHYSVDGLSNFGFRLGVSF